LLRNTEVCAIFCHFTAVSRTMLSESFSTTEHWVSRQGVWLAG
jgi:hypothetical protein